MHEGHSTDGNEVVHYLARHGESRVAKAPFSISMKISSYEDATL
jgi:hypothetical protein